MTRPGDIAGNLVGPETPLLEAIGRMDAARRKILLVVDADRRLLGAVTDGDIRRGLMRRLAMEAPVREVMNADPVALKVGSSDLTALARLEERGVSLAPVVDGPALTHEGQPAQPLGGLKIGRRRRLAGQKVALPEHHRLPLTPLCRCCVPASAYSDLVTMAQQESLAAEPAKPGLRRRQWLHG